MTDIPANKPFNIFFTPSPLRVPALVLWLAALFLGLGAIGIAYVLRINALLPASFFVLLAAFGVVAACGWVLHGQRNARAMLYAATATMVLIGTWMTFEDIQHRRATDRASHQLAVDLNQLCREDGGRNLADPACARYSRVFDNYHYPNGVPPEVQALRDEVRH